VPFWKCDTSSSSSEFDRSEPPFSNSSILLVSVGKDFLSFFCATLMLLALLEPLLDLLVLLDLIVFVETLLLSSALLFFLGQ
jgi:hypothetical protein